MQAIFTGSKVLLEMLAQAVKARVLSKLVFFDSWFSYPITIIEIVKLKLNVVARLKKSPQVKYMVNRDRKTLLQVYSSRKKRRGKSKYPLSVTVKIYNKDNEIIDARIVYVRDRNNKKNWLALISTDMSLFEEEIIQLTANGGISTCSDKGVLLQLVKDRSRRKVRALQLEWHGGRKLNLWSPLTKLCSAK